MSKFRCRKAKKKNVRDIGFLFFSNLSIPVNFLSFKSRMHEWFLWLLHKCGSTSEVMSQRLKIVHTYYYGQWNIQPRLIHIYRFCQILRCKFIGLFAARSIVLKIERKSVGGIEDRLITKFILVSSWKEINAQVYLYYVTAFQTFFRL